MPVGPIKWGLYRLSSHVAKDHADDTKEFHLALDSIRNVSCMDWAWRTASR